MRPIISIVLLALILLVSGCIQTEKTVPVIESKATAVWKADGAIGEGEYTHRMLLESPARQGYRGGDLEVSWKNDAEFLYIGLNGSTDGWVAIGFEPQEWMKDADIILAYAENAKAVVLDEYCTGNYGPHVEDTMLGGTNDIIESGAMQRDGRTMIELKRRLSTGDKFDKAFKPGQAISIIWALSDKSDSSLKHNVAYGEGIMTLTGGNDTVEPPEAAMRLTSREKEGMIFIWEEEKVARDLYSSLFRQNNLTIFKNLTESEQRHMDEAKAIILRYGLVVPENETPERFDNESLQRIYNELLAEGRSSDQDAIKAAAVFEEISIIDLKRELSSVQAEDIGVVYQGLLAGSRKHLRSYVSELHKMGIEYAPRHLDLGEFEKSVKAG
jgi:hypothetical protein